VVNSISLQEGEAEFVRQARLARRYGAAVIVMAFDEKGQADTWQAARDLQALLPHPGRGSRFSAEDVIFDPNIFAIATGIEEHNNYGRDYIEATAPSCASYRRQDPGGVSNVSFSFRGNDASARGDPHGVPLSRDKSRHDHGDRQRRAARVYEEIAPELRERRRGRGAQPAARRRRALVEFATTVKTGARPRRTSWSGARFGRRTVSRTRWSRASSSGSSRTPRKPVTSSSAHPVIEGPLMDA